MKRFAIALAAALLLGSPYAAGAHEMSHGKTTTITGEVVDTGCYLGHAARGASHTSCALKCVKGGMPMGVLTRQGALYLVTLNHDNPDPYNQLKDLAGKNVTVTGTLVTRSGMKGIDVTSVKPAA
ncbi:MAG TPA: hypothetical protein VFM00_06360 [Candidatus Eisenbacteria bacterium]|jgi:type 1 fimbria pilin|nr:hypothetical protein [Candidatus Eisenbacteria bacterium]